MKTQRIFFFLFIILTCVSALANSYEEAEALFEKQDYQQASEILLKLKENDDSFKVNTLLANIYVNQSDFKSAVKYAEAAIQFDPKHAQGHYMFGVSKGLELANGDGGIFKKLGAIKKVRRAFETAIYLDPEHIDARSALAQLHIMLPKLAGGSKKKALHQANEVYKYNKIQAYPLFVQIYQAQKNTKKARSILKEWTHAQPNEWNPIMATAYFEQQQGNITKAYELYSNWAKTQTESLQALYQIGKLAAVSGQYLPEGISSLTQYIEKVDDDIQPKKEYAYWRLAQIYQKQNKTAEAKAEIKKGLSLNPDNAQLLKLKAQL